MSSNHQRTYQTPTRSSQSREIGTYSRAAELLSYGQGIQLREEMTWMCNNTGYFVGWRRFDTSKRSEYWDSLAKEAIGGPPWEYDDYVFKTRRIIPGRTSLENEILQRFGTVEKGSIIYFVPYNIEIKQEDLFFQVYNETTKTIPTTVKIRKTYDITMIEPKIDDELIYNVVKVKIVVSKNDRTLRGYIPVTYIPV